MDPGFKPHRPQNAEGIRMLPPMSVPIPRADHPRAIRAPSPPELPPAERVLSNGFGIAPNI